MNELITRLEIYRLEHKISQKKLSEILGVTCATVNRWFKGRTCPNKIQTYQIEKLLKENK